MRMKVKLTFKEPWTEVINEVARQCGMSVDEYCDRAVKAFTKQGLEQGEQEHAQSGIHDVTRDAEEVRPGAVTDNNALANSDDIKLSTTPKS